MVYVDTDIMNWLMHLFKIQGFATPFAIFIRNDVSDKRRKELEGHEREHQKQMKRLWYIGFYLRYGYEYLRYGYNNMPLEIEARSKESSYG